MIEILADELYQLESERAKGAQLNANITLELEDLNPKPSKLISMYLKINIQNQIFLNKY